MSLHDLLVHCHRLTVFGQIILESPDGKRYFRSAWPKKPFELVAWVYVHDGYVEHFYLDELPEGIHYYNDGSGRTLDFRDEGWHLSEVDRADFSILLQDFEDAVQCLKDEELL